MNGKENPCLNTKAPSISSLGDEDGTAAIRRMTTTHGSTADIAARLGSARFTPQSRQSADMLACPLSATSRHMHRSKKAPLFDHFVGVSEQGMRRPTYDVCDADGSSSSRVFASAKSAAPHPASKNR